MKNNVSNFKSSVEFSLKPKCLLIRPQTFYSTYEPFIYRLTREKPGKPNNVGNSLLNSLNPKFHL